MGVFFIDTGTGQVATGRQLEEAGLVESGTGLPARPWLRIQGPGDASTMWYAVLHKEEKGVFIGTLAIRHGEHHASLLQRGWTEVAPEAITVPGAEPAPLSPSPIDHKFM